METQPTPIRELQTTPRQDHASEAHGVQTAQLDMSPEARLARCVDIQGKIAAGEAIDMRNINPKTHSPETVATLHQYKRHGSRAEF